MKSTMTADYVLPKQGFFSKPTYSHALMNPSTNSKPQPKRYNPDQYPAESVTWTKPQDNPFETSYSAAYKEPASKKITSRVKQEKPIVDRNLSDSLVPMRLPLETRRFIPGHHVSGIFGRNFCENPKPQLKQYPHIKNLDNMAQTTLALGPSIEREKLGMGALDNMHHHNQKNASNVLRKIYVNRSEVQETLRYNHDDAHFKEYNIANVEKFNNEIYQYNRVFGGRAGSSALTRRLVTPEPVRRERVDVKAHTIKKLLNNSYVGENDYSVIDRDFKNAYKAQAARRFHEDHFGPKTMRGRSTVNGSFSGGLTYDEFNRSRSRTPELGGGKGKGSRTERESVSETPARERSRKPKLDQGSPKTPKTSKQEKTSKSPTPTKSNIKASPPSMSVKGLIKKYK